MPSWVSRPLLGAQQPLLLDPSTLDAKSCKAWALSLWNRNEKEVFPSVFTAQRRWNLQLALSCVPGCFYCCPPLFKSVFWGLD